MFHIISARPQDRRAALELLFQHLAQAERQARVGNAERLLDAGQLDPQGIFTACDETGLRGVLVAVPLAGAGGLIWPPQTAPAANKDVADKLIVAAKDWLRRRGAKLAQTLLAPEEATLAAPLLRSGFVHVTRLEYLRHHLADVCEPGSPCSRFAFQTYQPAIQAIFHETLLRSYEGSLDCPELSETRSIDEIIAGHQAQGQFDPGRWWLAWEGKRAVGVLLVTRAFDEPGWDLSYVGVTPEVRRRGLGRALTQLALRQARDAGAGQLTLAVDLRNLPARNLYAQLGFQPTSQRDVYLTFLTPR